MWSTLKLTSRLSLFTINTNQPWFNYITYIQCITLINIRIECFNRIKKLFLAFSNFRLIKHLIRILDSFKSCVIKFRHCVLSFKNKIWKRSIIESKKFNKNLRYKMSIEIVDVDKIDYDFCSGLRGYHVYQQIWKPFIGQVIKLAREEKNPYDRFAISGLAKTPGKK